MSVFIASVLCKNYKDIVFRKESLMIQSVLQGEVNPNNSDVV